MSKVEMSKESQVKVLSAFRKNNPNYERVLDKPTLDNIKQLGGQIADNDFMFGDFLRAVQKVAETFVKSPQFKNPLAVNKRAISSYGSLIEEIFIGLVQEKGFRDSDPVKDLFKKESPNVDVVYFKKNRRAKYKVTEDIVELKYVMRGEDGVQNVIDRIVGSMSTSNEIDEYNYMKSLIDGAYANREMIPVVVGDIDNDPKAASNFIKKAKTFTGLAKYPNRWNARGVLNTSDSGSLTHYLPVKTKALLDVDVLSRAFNIGNTEYMGREIEVDRFEDDNVLAVTVDDSFFIVADHVREIKHQADASALTVNYFLHVHQTLARSPFATSIVYVKELPEDMQGRVLIDPVVGIIAPQLDREDSKSITVNVDVEPFEGATADLSQYTITAEADTAGIDVEVVDNKQVVLSINGASRAGESFQVDFTATYDTDKTITTKGLYTISENYKE